MDKRFGASTRMTESTLLALGYGAWLASYPLLIFLLPNDIVAGGLGLCFGVAVNLLHLMLRPQDIPTTPTVWLYIGLFGLLIFVSQLIGNFEGATLASLFQCAAMITIMFIAGCIANPTLFARTMRFYTLFISGMLLIVIADGDYVWGRLVGRGQPNFWGMMSLSCVLAALSIESRLKKAVPIAIAFTVLFLSNSRGSMIATFIGLVTASAVYFLTHGARKRLVILSSVAIVLVALVWSEVSMHLISDRILHLDDPRRGIDSGFTGRLDPWLYGIQLAMERPLFGYGYRASESLFGAIDVSSVHNGYLSMLLDTGVLGLVAWIAFLSHVISVGFRRLRRPFATCAVAFLVAYSVLGLVERYALNAGQPLSILFLASAFYMLRPWAPGVLRRQREAGVPTIARSPT
jgi:O-antigen ligase